jgi:hypothetical protein
VPCFWELPIEMLSRTLDSHLNRWLSLFLGGGFHQLSINDERTKVKVQRSTLHNEPQSVPLASFKASSLMMFMAPGP